MYKIFIRVLNNRIERVLDENQTREQAGFRKGYSTTDHMQAKPDYREDKRIQPTTMYRLCGLRKSLRFQNTRLCSDHYET